MQPHLFAKGWAGPHLTREVQRDSVARKDARVDASSAVVVVQATSKVW